MRILQVLLSPRVGGAETLVAELDSSWAAHGVTTEVAYLDRDAAGAGRSTRYRSLRRRMRGFRPDVVVSHSALPNVYARLAAPVGVPVVTVLHSATDDHGNDRVLWTAELLLGPRTAHVVAVSRVQAEVYLTHFPRRRSRTTVVPNGVRAGLAPGEPAPHARTVGVLARVDAQKRPDVWVEAARVVLEEHPALQFRWWGPIPPAPDLDRLLGAPRPPPSGVRFEGVASSVPDALAGLDVYFHAADREAMSMSLLEAAVCGLPVVCADEVASTLPPVVAADVFRAGDAQQAARALTTCLAHFAERSSAARDVAGRIRAELGIDACAAAYLELFSAVTARPARRRPTRWVGPKAGRRRSRVDTLDR